MTTEVMAVQIDDDNDDRELELLAARIPEVSSAFARIPGLFGMLRHALGTPRHVWDVDSDSDISNKVIMGAMQLEIEKLQAMFQDIEKKYAVAMAAERNWRVALREKTAVVFRSDVGQVAKMPLDLVDVLARKATFDGQVIEGERSIGFARNGKLLCRIPKGLFTNLEKVLSSWNGATA